MQYRHLGRWGVKVSAVGLGSWMTLGDIVDDKETGAIVRKALEGGINLFDSADVYTRGAAEEALSRALDGVRRSDIVLATKCYFPVGDGPNERGLSRKHVMESCHGSLARLQTDYLDLYQCHRYDDETPLEETVRAMDDLIRQGKILYWGVSMWGAQQIHNAVTLCRELGAAFPVSNQPHYNLLTREIEAEVLPACDEHGLGILPFSPLAQGVLTGKYNAPSVPEGSRAADKRRSAFMKEYLEADRLERVARMQTLAERDGMTAARMALAWLLSHKQVSSVLVGATSVEQLDENLGAAEVELSKDVLEKLDELFPA